MKVSSVDVAVFAAYVVCLLCVAYYVSREKVGHQKNTNDYFLAGSSLPWWAIGASMIAANISAEQIIGMSGSAYVMGIAIASYEWMAAITLLMVGKYLLPVFLKRKIYTMPQFLEKRYDHRVRMVIAVFWLGVYMFVNLTSILWLGSLAIATVTGIDQDVGMFFSSALPWRIRSMVVSRPWPSPNCPGRVSGFRWFAALLRFAEQDRGGAGVWPGSALTSVAGRFDMILSRDNPHYDLPGVSVLIGGLWVMHFSYWGFNQYIIQRALGAKSIREAQNGIVFAAFLKMLMPILVVLPGIAAIMLVPELTAPDRAYPEVMKLLPVGVKGLVFSALIAAIVSSLASMTNSISTIFTMDMYVHYKTDRIDHYVRVGRIVGFTAMVIAVFSPSLAG